MSAINYRVELTRVNNTWVLKIEGDDWLAKDIHARALEGLNVKQLYIAEKLPIGSVLIEIGKPIADEYE